MTNMPYELDVLIDKLNKKDFNAAKSILEVFSQNILGFSGYVLLKSLTNDPLSPSELSDAMLYTSIAYLMLDPFVLNNEKIFSYVEKAQALTQAEELLRIFDEHGISISVDDLKKSVRKTSNYDANQYYTFDNSDNIRLLIQTKRGSLFRKRKVFGIVNSGYEYLTLYKVIDDFFGDMSDDDEVKKNYELAFKQDEDIGIFNFSLDKDDIEIISTEGLDHLSEKEKYLKLCAALQDIEYKRSKEINSKIKAKIF